MLSPAHNQCGDTSCDPSLNDGHFRGEEDARNAEFARNGDCDGDADAEEKLLMSGRADGEVRAGKVRCPECGKCFKNNKSMFGHLRSHPNRGYKGANPPVRKLQPSTKGASLPDHGESKKKLEASPPDIDTLSFSELFAASILLMLKRKREQPLDSNQQHNIIEHADAGRNQLVVDGAEARNNNNLAVRDEHDLMGVQPKRAKKSKDVLEAHRKKDVPEKGKCVYTCKQCKAAFSTYQALGGHMAGHNKDKRIQSQNAQEATQEKCQDEMNQRKNEQGGANGKCWCDDDVGVSSTTSKGSQGEHVCKVCHKEWHSGQALGGHMRQHFERREHGLQPLPLTPTPTMAAAAATTDGGRHRPLDIDLNVEAREQE